MFHPDTYTLVEFVQSAARVYVLEVPGCDLKRWADPKRTRIIEDNVRLADMPPEVEVPRIEPVDLPGFDLPEPPARWRTADYYH